MEHVIRLKHWALYGAVLAMVAAALFVFVSTVTSGDSSSTPEYHGKDGGLGDFWTVKCSGDACNTRPQPYTSDR